MIAALFSFLKVAVICLTALTALFIVLLAMPKSPIRDFVLRLTQRVGATAVGVALVPPVDLIPVVGEVYDIAALAFIVYYWYTLFKGVKENNLIQK